MEWDAVAADLMSALDHGLMRPPVSESVPDFDVVRGYALGARLIAARRERGERTVGRKLGFTNSALWELLQVEAPFWSVVYDSTVTFLDAGAGQANISPMSQPRLEPEVVLHFSCAPPERADETELLACIDWIAPAFEIVQSHFPDWRFHMADAIADFGVHGALVVGPPAAIGTMDDPVRALANFTMVLSRNGVEQARGGGERVLGSPLRALVRVMAGAVDQAGWEPIQAGEIVTTGTLTGLHGVAPGEEWLFEAAGIPVQSVQLEIISG